MRVPQPLPYQGSKRGIAKTILSFFPERMGRLVEPFAGSIAVTLAAAANNKASEFYINDINEPLMDLWENIINNPEDISNKYDKLWYEQSKREKEFYFQIRDKFNNSNDPSYFLYLLARCVKASIRYNSKGEFNQSPDNRRKGRHPSKMRLDIFMASKLLKGRTIIAKKDYKEILNEITNNDLIYMDPPYQGVCNGRNPRYFSSINFDEFMSQLNRLVEKGIPFILSYDGYKGKKSYGKKIPSDMGVYKINIEAGPSTQSTLLGRKEITFESLYLSKKLVEILQLNPTEIPNKLSNNSLLFKGMKQIPLPI